MVRGFEDMLALEANEGDLARVQSCEGQEIACNADDVSATKCLWIRGSFAKDNDCVQSLFYQAVRR